MNYIQGKGVKLGTFTQKEIASKYAEEVANLFLKNNNMDGLNYIPVVREGEKLVQVFACRKQDVISA